MDEQSTKHEDVRHLAFSEFTKYEGVEKSTYNQQIPL
jgi:hypothetical protein